MTEPEPNLKFDSKEELNEMCRTLAARLHYLNRVAIGESKFAWNVADMLQRLGRVFDEQLEDKDTRAAFGDGWTAGTVPRDEQPKALFELLYPPKELTE